MRSAQLTGASCFGVLRHLYPDGAIPAQTIAVEGSVLEHVRGSLFMLEDALHICQAGFARGKKIEASPRPSPRLWLPIISRAGRLPA